MSSHKLFSSGNPILTIDKLINVGDKTRIFKCIPSGGDDDERLTKDINFTAKLNHLVDNGQLSQNTIIEVTNYSKTYAKHMNSWIDEKNAVVGEKLITLILQFKVLQSGSGVSPIEMNASSLFTSSTSQPQPQSQPSTSLSNSLYSQPQSSSNPFLPPPSKQVKRNPYVQIIDLDENHNQFEWTCNSQK